MWLISSIAAGAMVVALILAYILKSRIRDHDTWEKLDDTNAPAQASLSVLSLSVSRKSSSGSGQIQKSRVLTMTTSPSVTTSRSPDAPNLRRSSRIEQPVSLLVLGTNRHGEAFRESTSALSLNLHGCRYSSHHEYPPEGWVTLQVTGTEGAGAQPVRARVCSIYTSSSPRERCQVGVELETPANIWGINSPPEDWLQILGVKSSAAPAAAPAPAVVPVPSPVDSAAARLSTLLEQHLASTERRAEVTMFPGPAASSPPAETAAAKESAIGGAPPQRMVLTAEQILQALQGRLQNAADRAVQNAIATQLHEAIRSGVSKIDAACKSNVHQAEEVSAARLTDSQNRWERELVVYRSRAEEIARRLETLAAQAQQPPVDSRKILERLQAEFEPKLQTHLEQSVAQAASQSEARLRQLSAQHLAQLAESSRQATNEANSRFDLSLAEMRSLVENAPAAVSEERLESLVNSTREQTLNHMEDRLAEIWKQFEQQQDLAHNHSAEIAQQLEKLSVELRDAQSRQEQALAEVRSLLTAANAGVSPEHLESRMTSSGEQFHNLLEWRLGEVSAHFQRLHDATAQQSEDLARRFESLAAGTRVQQTPPQLDLATIEHSVDRASRDFETSAARISDRQLVRLMEQKQVLTREVALELEARASETRATLQKAANVTLDDFQQRVQGQIDHIIEEATERMVSTLTTLDAESRASCEARRHALEADVARAAERSTAEFRTGIKAFLYSCLVAAVSAVDEHAQNTMAGLAKDPSLASLPFDAPPAPSSSQPETRASAAPSAPSSDSHD